MWTKTYTIQTVNVWKQFLHEWSVAVFCISSLLKCIFYEKAVQSSKKGYTRDLKVLKESTALWCNHLGLHRWTTWQPSKPIPTMLPWDWNLTEQRQVSFGFNEIPFMGHVVRNEGLKLDPSKIKAIFKMELPKDKGGVERLRGAINYLSIPKLSVTD